MGSGSNLVGRYSEAVHTSAQIGLQARLECVAAMAEDESIAAKTSKLISVLFGDMPESMADRLSSNERQVRLLEKAMQLGQWPAYFVTACRRCKNLSDVTISREDFQDSISGKCPSSCQLKFEGKTLKFRTPIGNDEKLVLDDAGLRSAALLEMLHVSKCSSQTADEGDGDPLSGISEYEADALLLKVLEKCSPPVGVLNLSCPSCKTEIRFWFDSVDWISRHIWSAIEDVTVLARAFGWTEEAICALPESRREYYLREAREMLQ